jgi:soluble lytic murein transglycosylase
MTRTARGLVAGVAIAVIAAGAAHAAPTVRVRPAAPHFSELVSPQDFDLLREGLRAADDGEWRRVRTIESQIEDDAASALLRWRAATSDPSLSFGDLEVATKEFANWPRARDIRSELEARIASSGLSAAEIVAWFEDATPRSGEGFIALADALFALGREAEGEDALRTAWRERILPVRVQNEVLARHRSRLTREDHIARVDYLLWREQRSAASRLYSELPSDYRALADARSRLAARSSGVDAAVARVPDSLVNDPGLLYERARWRRKARRTADALPLILDIPSEFGPAIGPASVWYERRVHISRTLDDGDFDTAYRLASAHSINPDTDPEDFADAEWLAGWLALQKLDNHEAAALHFARLDDAVSTPISKARALYWRGRAAEASDDPTAAEAFYRSAAAFPTAYYGQLAAAELTSYSSAILPLSAQPNDANRAAFNAIPLARATALLAELDELWLYREFSYQLDDQLDRPVDLVLLAEIAEQYGQSGVGVRAGKAGLAHGVVEPSAAYPLPRLTIPENGPSPEPALVYALARQESEFYHRAVSPVGARGLMQMMPATARLTARQVGATYRENWLTDDPDYNVRLGSAHLADLIDDFDGSYILAAAAYNAGASRANRWIREYGDPRGQVDPIDWVESIPFSETRNYVQRVLENTLVYRARLGDGRIEATLVDDLGRGGPGN